MKITPNFFVLEKGKILLKIKYVYAIIVVSNKNSCLC